MTDVDNPEVGAETSVAEGQNQEASILGTEAAETPQIDTPVSDWRDGLSDELKGSKSLQSIKTVEDLAKGFVNAQSVIGRRLEDLTPDQVREYYSELGAPSDPDGYELSAPEGLEADSDLTDWYKKAAHENGIPKEAAEKMYQAYMQMEQEVGSQTSALADITAKEQVDQLKADFGPAYAERTELANKALTEFGGEEAIQAINELGLGNHPALVKLLANAGETLAEGKFVSGQNTGRFGMTSEEASQKIDTLRKDPEFMSHYRNPASAQNSGAKKQMEDLYKVKVNS